MSNATVTSMSRHHLDATAPSHVAGQIPIVPLGMSVGLFLAVTFTLCVGFGLLLPGWAMHEAWSVLLPGFVWLSWPSFFLGLAESFAYGWYVALIFGPLYNFFAARSQSARA